MNTFTVLKEALCLALLSLIMLFSPSLFASQSGGSQASSFSLKPGVKIPLGPIHRGGKTSGGIAGGGHGHSISGYVMNCPTLESILDSNAPQSFKEVNTPELMEVLENLRTLINRRSDLSPYAKLRYYVELSKFIEGARKILEVNQLCIDSGEGFSLVYAATNNTGNAGGENFSPIYITRAITDPNNISIPLVIEKQGELTEYVSVKDFIDDTFVDPRNSGETPETTYVKYKLYKTILHELTHEVIPDGIFDRTEGRMSEEEELFVIEFTNRIMNNEPLLKGKGWDFMTQQSDISGVTPKTPPPYSEKPAQNSRKDLFPQKYLGILEVPYEDQQQEENPCHDLTLKNGVQVSCDKSISAGVSRTIVNPVFQMRGEELPFTLNTPTTFSDITMHNKKPHMFCQLIGLIDGQNYQSAILTVVEKENMDLGTPYATFKRFENFSADRFLTMTEYALTGEPYYAKAFEAYNLLPVTASIEKETKRSRVVELTCIKGGRGFSMDVQTIPNESYKVVSLGDDGSIQNSEEIKKEGDGSLVIRNPRVQFGNKLVPLYGCSKKRSDFGLKQTCYERFCQRMFGYNNADNNLSRSREVKASSRVGYPMSLAKRTFPDGEDYYYENDLSLFLEDTEDSTSVIVEKLVCLP